jgi:hypothetical protein
MTPSSAHSDRAIFARWLLWMLVLNLLWEVLQLPLYTVPPSSIPFYKAYALVHCTVGDGLIAAGIYVGAALVAGWRWPLDAPDRGLAVLLPPGIAYTAYSEWRNVYVTASWAYDPLMPTLAGIGIAPLAQWLVLPPVAVWLLRNIPRAR